MHSAKGLAPALLNIGSTSPPGYPSAWLPPGRDRLHFTWQVHCSSAAPCCSQLPGCPSFGPNCKRRHYEWAENRFPTFGDWSGHGRSGVASPIQRAQLYRLDNQTKKNDYSFCMAKVSAAHRTHRRRQILQAAFHCFARSGFHGTSMQDVCREAKLSPGAVYLYFASKESILEALAQAFRSQTAEWLAQCSGKRLSEVIAQILQQLNRPEGLPEFRLDVRLWGEAIHTPALAAIYRQSEATLLDGLAHIVMNAPPKRTRKQAQTIARFLVAVISGFELQKVMKPEVDLGPAVAFLKVALQANLNRTIPPDVRRTLPKGGKP